MPSTTKNPRDPRRRAGWRRLAVAAALSLSVALGPAPQAGAPAATVVRGPYLQLGTPTSVLVRWRTDAPTDSRVRYAQAVEPPGGPAQAPAPGSLTQEAGDAVLTTEHQVLLTGLTPNTRYDYAVGYGPGGAFVSLSGEDAEHFFDTAPLAGQLKPVRVWALGDSGEGNQNVLNVRDRYYELSAQSGRHTELWLMLGDNAYPQGTDADYQVKLFDVFGKMLRKSVVWPTLGNHELYDAEQQSWPYFDLFSLPTAGQAGGLPSATESYYSFDYANIHFVSLDSATYVPGTLAASPMLDWLEADLAATTQDWTVAFFHHPPYSKGVHDSDDATDSMGRLIDMRTLVLPILEAHGVDLVLAGHSHSYERSYLIAGHYGDSSTFDPGQHLIDGGNGVEDDDGAYQAQGPGAVFTVAGSASILSPGKAEALGGEEGVPPHPAMYTSLYLFGSVVLDFDGNRVDAMLLGADGATLDHYTLIKGQSESPVADFSASPLSVALPLEVDFTDVSAKGPTAWSWDFDNNGTTDSVARHPSYQYSAPGIYSVRLTVSNSSGSDDVTKPNLICASAGPPSEIKDLALTGDRATLVWHKHWQATSYDIVRGDLIQLLKREGDFTLASQCLTTVSEPETSDPEIPPSGQGYFYIVRGTNCAPEAGTYDEGGAGQLTSRDPLLQGDGSLACACPSGSDPDGDGYCAGLDNCPGPAEEPEDLDDSDGDGLGAMCDNCLDVPNPAQSDLDLDGQGDPCDACTDQDQDGYGDPSVPWGSCPPDNCPTQSNPSQQDLDGDGLGNACDSCPSDPANDVDADLVCGSSDNCVTVPNPGQEDFDGDGAGDACDADDDQDGSADGADCLPLATGVAAAPGAISNLRMDKLTGPSLRWDRGFQGHTSNVYQAIRPAGQPIPTSFGCLAPELPEADLWVGQAILKGAVVYYLVAARNACGENEIDLVNVPCPTQANESDGDGIPDLADNCPLAANANQKDSDFDFVGDACDNCPALFNPGQTDSDLDGKGDACE